MLKLCPRIFSATNVTQMVTGTTTPAINAVPRSRKKEPDDESGEEKADDDRVAHAADGCLDDVRLIVEDGQLHAGGDNRAQAFDFLMNFVGYLDRVAVRLAIDAEQHGRLSVRGDHGIVRRRRSRNGADIANANRHVVHVLDDDVADLLGRLNLRRDESQEKLMIAA